MDDSRFQGGGTSLSDLKNMNVPQQGYANQHQMMQQQMQQQQPQQPPQQQPPQMQAPLYQQQQMMQQQQEALQQRRMMMQQQQQQQTKEDKTFIKQFQQYTNCNPLHLFIVIILFILFSNSYIYSLERTFLPSNMIGFENPPLILVLINAIIFGIIFLVVCKFV